MPIHSEEEEEKKTGYKNYQEFLNVRNIKCKKISRGIDSRMRKNTQKKWLKNSIRI